MTRIVFNAFNGYAPMLARRTVSIASHNVGDKHDPYQRVALSVHQVYADGTELKVVWTVCALAGWCLHVNDSVAFNFTEDTDKKDEIIELFTDLVGVHLSIVCNAINRRSRCDEVDNAYAGWR
jgi:hypothetical protein